MLPNKNQSLFWGSGVKCRNLSEQKEKEKIEKLKLHLIELVSLQQSGKCFSVFYVVSAVWSRESWTILGTN